MGEEQLLRALDQEAEDKCRDIVCAAEELRNAELIRSKSEASAKKDAALTECRLSLEKEAAAKIAEARRDAMVKKLEAKTGIINGVFEEALKKIETLDKEAYSSYLRLLHNELEKSWPSEVDAVICVNPKDMPLIASKAAALEADDSVKLGIVFKSKDGSHHFENTARSRLEKARADLVIKLNNFLFQEDK